MNAPVICHGCTAAAVVAYRIKPKNHGRQVWDDQPVTVNACSAHVQAAKDIGTILSSTPLTDAVVTRKLE